MYLIRAIIRKLNCRDLIRSKHACGGKLRGIQQHADSIDPESSVGKSRGPQMYSFSTHDNTTTRRNRFGETTNSDRNNETRAAEKLEGAAYNTSSSLFPVRAPSEFGDRPTTPGRDFARSSPTRKRRSTHVRFPFCVLKFTVFLFGLLLHRRLNDDSGESK